MNLNMLIESIEAEAMTKVAEDSTAKDKPLVSKELEAVLTKEAAATNASRAFTDGEKTAKEILEKLAAEAVSAITAEDSTVVGAKTEEVKQETTAPVSEVEKVAEENKTEVAPATKTEVQAVEATAESTTEENMNKQAQDAGKELAKMILEKAAEGVVVNSAQTPPVANRLQADNAEMVSQHDQRIMPTPGRNGTINAVFDGIVARAKALSNPVSYDQVAAGDQQSGHEGVDHAMGTPAEGTDPDVIDKTAAVNALVEEGLSWEDAVDLVKAAAYEIEQEELGQIKLAAVQELMGQGVDFDSAVEAVQVATTPNRE